MGINVLAHLSHNNYYNYPNSRYTVVINFTNWYANDFTDAVAEASTGTTTTGASTTDGTEKITGK